MCIRDRLGTTRIAAGDLDGAREVFEALAGLLPRDPRAPYFLATIALRHGDEDEARRWVDESLRRDPRFTTGLVALGGWLRADGREAEAIRMFEDALERDPTDEDARRGLNGGDAR